jgi:hypothetical protein
LFFRGDEVVGEIGERPVVVGGDIGVNEPTGDFLGHRR